MMIFEDGKYHGSIPPQEAGVSIKYYIKIYDISGNLIKTEIYEFNASTFEISPVIISIIGVASALVGTISTTLILKLRKKKGGLIR